MTLNDFLDRTPHFGDGIIFRNFGPTTLTTPREARIIATTDAPDRLGHIIRPEGIDTTNFWKNPVIMWNHEGYNDPAKIIGKAVELERTPSSIIALIRYLSPGISDFVDYLWELESSGMLPGNSIGIRPTGSIEEAPNGQIIIGSSELTDISKVSIGMNPHAVSI
jgi:hypothetical protein